MKALILAGGMGTRLRSVTGGKPKPMADLLGRPVMEHIVRLLRENGYGEICAALQYRAGEISNEEYDKWRYNYPQYDDTQIWAKVPSQEFSDAMVKAFKRKLKE